MTMKTKIMGIVLFALTNAFLLHGVNTMLINNQSFIFGKITTVDGEVYQGQIRWGKEEAFWFDMFNASKDDNENLKYLTDEEMDMLDEKDNQCNNNRIINWGWSNNYSWNGNDHSHSFACQFGDIKRIIVSSRRKTIVELKNGDDFVVGDGSNDIGAKVQVADQELGLIKLEWNRIKYVEFMDTPNQLESYFGTPLYGTVKTYRGSFEGFLQWDHDERLSEDELNGDYEDGELDIKFGNIKQIKKRSRGSDVVLNSGRSFYMDGSNDVDDDNRGIIVNIPGSGRVDIPWDEFEEITFTDQPRNTNISYRDFNGHEPIRGTVTTITGDNLSGEIIYDLDERYSLEILDGVIDDIEHSYPFYNVRSIEPKNREESMVELVNGERLLLSDKVDVNRDNDGVLVFNGNDHTYIPWNQIELVRFN